MKNSKNKMLKTELLVLKFVKMAPPTSTTQVSNKILAPSSPSLQVYKNLLGAKTDCFRPFLDKPAVDGGHEVDRLGRRWTQIQWKT